MNRELKKLIEEIKLVRGKDVFVGETIPKGRVLKEISKKLNDELKKFYTPEFLDKIYSKIKEIGVYRNPLNGIQEPWMSGTAEAGAGTYSLVISLLNKSSVASRLRTLSDKIKEQRRKKRLENLEFKWGDDVKTTYKKKEKRPFNDTINIFQNGTSHGRKYLIKILLHEVQHIIDGNFKEIAYLKRDLILLLKKYKNDILIEDEIKRKKIIEELLTIFLAPGTGSANVEYKTWENIVIESPVKKDIFMWEIIRKIKKHKIFKNDFIKKRILNLPIRIRKNNE